MPRKDLCMDITQIKRMYDKGYSIDFIVNEYYKFKNSKVQQNYFNGSGNLVVTKKFKKKDVYNYVYQVLYSHYMNDIKEKGE